MRWTRPRLDQIDLVPSFFFLFRWRPPPATGVFLRRVVVVDEDLGAGTSQTNILALPWTGAPSARIDSRDQPCLASPTDTATGLGHVDGLLMNAGFVVDEWSAGPGPGQGSFLHSPVSARVATPSQASARLMGGLPSPAGRVPRTFRPYHPFGNA